MNGRRAVKGMGKLKALGLALLGLVMTYVCIGLYAPFYSLEEHELGCGTVGKLYEEILPDSTGFEKFIGQAQVVIFDVVSFGVFFDALTVSLCLDNSIETCSICRLPAEEVSTSTDY